MEVLLELLIDENNNEVVKITRIDNIIDEIKEMKNNILALPNNVTEIIFYSKHEDSLLFYKDEIYGFSKEVDDFLEEKRSFKILEVENDFMELFEKEYSISVERYFQISKYGIQSFAKSELSKYFSDREVSFEELCITKKVLFAEVLSNV